jgi:flagellin
MPITGITNNDANNIASTFAKNSDAASNSTRAIASGTRLTKASIDASSLAIAAKLDSNINVLTQANRNAAQGACVVQLAVGAQQNIQGLLTSMKALTTKSNDGTQDDKARALIDSEFQKLLEQVDNISNQVRWNGTPLLSGGAPTVGAAHVVGANAVAGLGALVAATFKAGPAPIDVANSHGLIAGTFTSSSVVADGATGNYTVSLTMVNNTPAGQVTQVFTGAMSPALQGGSLVLQGSIDKGNVLQIDYDAAAAPAGLNNAANIKAALDSVLNLGAGKNGATIAAYSTALNGGVTSITASASAAAGTYALSYDNVNHIMKITDGNNAYYQNITADGDQSVEFQNGLTVNMTGGTFTMAGAITQSIFDVTASNSAVSMNVQVAEKSSDVIGISVLGSSTSALGLTGLSVATQAGARSAGTSLDQALQSLNSSVASLGAQQKQLEYASNNLKTTIENNVAARGVYADTDVAAEMTKLTQATVFTQLSQAMLSQSLEMQRGLVRLAQG